MFASNTTGIWRWIAIATATFAVAGQAFAQDAQVVEEPASSLPSSLELSASAHVDVEPGAIVERMPRVALPMSGNASVRAYQLRLREGTIHIDIAGQERSDLEIRVVGDKLVELPAADANGPVLVRTPSGQVVIVEHGRATVTVVHGHLRVTNRHGKTLAGPAQAVSALVEGQARVEGCAGPSVRPVPAVPAFSRGERIWVAVGAEMAHPGTLAWTESEGAARYRVRVERDDQGAEPVSLSVEGTNLGDAAPPLAPGRYAVKLRAVDACGITSEETLAEHIRVVGLGLPSGSYQDAQGTIRTEVGTRIRLTHAQGTRLSYPNVDRWVDAPGALSLRRDAEQSFLLSTQGGVPTLIRLAPRNIQASVQLGPHNVRWPGPSVAVTVKLEAGDGQDLPSWLEPVTKVMVGAKQVHLRWQRDGNTLRGVIPAQPGVLPCVVRVEVTDQFGIPLGRSFLEVARSPS